VVGRARRSIQFWQPLARLAPSSRAWLRFWLVTLELTLRHKLERRPRRPRRLDLAVNGVPVSLEVAGIGEVHGLREVLVQGDYERPAPIDPDVIVDLGGNIGASAVYFATRYPNARIIVVEPDPDSFERLERNTGRFERVTPVRAAATARDGQVELYRTGYSLTESLLPGAPGAEPLPVEGLSLDSLLEREGVAHVDLLKFDIEGLEYAVFENSARLSDVRAAVGEVHERVMGATTEELRRLFDGCETTLEPLPNGEHLFRAWRA
jgi:FkbM family methyltransferase